LQKSITTPSLEIECLDFQLDSREMQISHPRQKLKILTTTSHKVQVQTERFSLPVSTIVGDYGGSSPSHFASPLILQEVGKSKIGLIEKGPAL
jgi:hypothetical protein